MRRRLRTRRLLAPPSIPVETLIESMKPEKPLVIESGTGGFGTAGQSINSEGGRGAGAATSGGMGAPQQ